MTTNERTAATAIVYIAIAVILFMLATSSAHGQAPEDTASAATLRRMRDSIDARIDSVERRRDFLVAQLAVLGLQPIPTPKKERAAWPWAVAVPFALYLVGGRDYDAGGYKDSYRATSDKVAHCGAHGLITAGLIDFGVKRWKAAGISALGAGAFELGQRVAQRNRHGGRLGYASPYDIGYGAACSAGVSLVSFTFR